MFGVEEEAGVSVLEMLKVVFFWVFMIPFCCLKLIYLYSPNLVHLELDGFLSIMKIFLLH